MKLISNARTYPFLHYFRNFIQSILVSILSLRTGTEMTMRAPMTHNHVHLIDLETIILCYHHEHRKKILRNIINNDGFK